MLRFSPSLQSILNATSTKAAWADALRTALGATRRLRGFRSADPEATDPAANGVEFLNVGMTGTIGLLAGNITSFGLAAGYTTRAAADLSTGSSVLRLEGNGHWVEGTLGLTGSGKDFTVPASPTATTGIGFKAAAASIKAPKLRPSGTGPTAPPSSTTTPYSVELFDWTNPGSPVSRGTILFNTRVEDLVFEDPEIAAEMGDVRITQCSSTIAWGEFEFGAFSLSMNALLNEEANVPVHQVLIACKPYGRWSSYPANDTLNRTTDVTCPPPFKVVLRDVGGNLLYTYEMRDGLPINSPQMSQVRGDFTPLRPLFNCAMMLPWSSHRIKKSTKATKFWPGVQDSFRRPTAGRQGATVNGAVPLLAGRTQINSMNHWYGAPKWPVGSLDSTINDALDPNADPYVFIVQNYFAASGNLDNLSRATGWGYEPGAIGTHDWYTGPGGPRYDRMAVPCQVTDYMSDPNGTHLRSGAPLKETTWNYGLNFFNHSHHYVRNLKTFATVPVNEAVYGGWSYGPAYYGGNDSGYVPGGTARHVDARCLANGSSSNDPPVDRDGRLPWGGFAMDNLHAYAAPEIFTLLFNSPMHFVSGKMRFEATFMAQLLHANPAITGGFLERNGAWRWLHWTLMWKMGTQHYLGIPRATIEDRWAMDMVAIYDTYVEPATNPAHPGYMSDDSKLLRAVGQRRSDSAATENTALPANEQRQAYTVKSSALCFYMTAVFVLMKQTGAFDAMYSKGGKCQATIDFMITCYDKFAIENLLDTQGRAEVYTFVAPTTLVIGETLSTNFVTSWADWAVKFPRVGVEDWMHNSDGSIRGERDVSQHMRAQWIYVRKDFFPTLNPHPRLDEAVAQCDAYYAERTAYVAAEPNPQSARNRDWTYQFSTQGRLKTPTT